MTATYGDGTSVWGAVTMDKLTIGSYTATAPVAISYLQSEGYALQRTGTYMDGLWGMGYSTFNGGQPTVMDTLVSAGMPNIFSICMTNTGGYLVMGGINTAYHTGAVRYTPIVEESYYVMRVNSVAIGARTLASSLAPKIILDSGTTFSYVPRDMYQEMADILIEEGVDSRMFSNTDRIFCGTLPTIITNLPDIVFTLPAVGGGSFTLRFNPRQYTMPCNDPGYYAFGFQVGSDSLSILGDTFMRPWNNIFDRAQKQLGFAPVSSACNGYVERTSGSKTIPAKPSPFSAATSSYTPSTTSIALFLTSCILFFA